MAEKEVEFPYESKLKDGLIPAHTDCPFKMECSLVEYCSHEGKKHSVKYSCAAARAHDSVHQLRHHKDMRELQRTRKQA